MNDHICSDHLHCAIKHQPSVNRMLWELNHFARLDANGWVVGGPTYEEIQALSVNEQVVQDAVASWQRFRPELKEDGVFGERSHFTSQQEIGNRCGCPDLMRRPGNLAEWPPTCQDVPTSFDSTRMKYDFDGKTPAEVWDEGNAIWNEVCGIVLSTVQPGNDARISAIMGSMGGGTLAWSYLANGSCSSRLRQEYNRAKTWFYHSFLWVNSHEKGHALGLSHTSKPGNIMQPYYSPSLSKLGPWEIGQVVTRYGKPADVPTPPTPVPPVPPTPGPVSPAPVGSIVQTADGVQWEMEGRYVRRAT
jgi:hypothetical protein